MITEQMIARINELAHKANSVGLTDDEIEERNELRKKYIEAFRTSLRAQLDNIEFVDEPDGKKRPDSGE
ncbi:MAG: hypothetical protein K0R67_3231 [Paenibacillus sp.]|jgi:uncharacterized protein YnzC (UPF0291/DUF896 family)|nr:hypothetical protein [Paenibacillus sp.]